MSRLWFCVLIACGSPRAPAPAPAPTPAPLPAPAPADPPAESKPVPPKPPATVAANAIQLEIGPKPVYLERTDSALLVNCDLIVRNTSSEPFKLSEIELSVFDRTGTLVFRKFVSGNGVSPSIDTIPNRVLAANAQHMILNPVHTLPRDLDVTKARFTVTYQHETGEQILVATEEVAPRDFVGKAKLVLPLAGRLVAWSGHDFLSHHRRWDYTDPRLVQFGFDSNAARYSYDLIPVNERGEMRNGPPGANESWFGFGKPVLAPAAGKIVAFSSKHPDNREFDMGALKANLLVMFGNYIVIEHSDTEYSLLAHLKQDSVKVQLDDVVRAGQEIAAVGASGSSLMPHLHYQLQTHQTGHAEGLPAYFHKFVKLRGRRAVVARGHVDTGDIVESRAK
jgi:murein DD-endopeptidase MepM/ murein hydrolase activator NlpD